MPLTKGHNFPFDETPCTICGITREHFEDSGEPSCRGRLSTTPRGVAQLQPRSENPAADLMQLLVQQLGLKSGDEVSEYSVKGLWAHSNSDFNDALAVAVGREWILETRDQMTLTAEGYLVGVNEP
jgi:hypothetical protein